MSCSLSSVEARLPPGFRFHPKDEELICEYLIKWVAGFPHPFPSLIHVDLNKCEPWDIPESACVGGKEWYFYSQKDRKYATGLRTNRATISGYWKATGKDRPVVQNGTLVGMRKTLVFYQGRAPKGRKTDWVMHEFRRHGPSPKTSHPIKEDWVLCRVFFKSRREIIPSKQGANAAAGHVSATPPSSPSLPGLMDQAYSIPFEGHLHQPEQVPCFSIFSQTNPNNFSHHVDAPQMLFQPPSRIFMPAISPTLSEYYIHNNNAAASTSSCGDDDNNNSNNNNNDDISIAVMKESSAYLMTEMDHRELKGSPMSFGEAAGSSDSYLSEVGLSSSMWLNQFQC